MAAQPFKLSSKADYASFVDAFDTFMFDCDDVLWHHESPVPGVAQVLEHLRSLKKKIIFVTNNSAKSSKSFKMKFDRLGLPAEAASCTTVDEIFGSAYASAVYISSVLRLPKDEKVYVIGGTGMEEDLDEEGIQHLGGTDPADKTLDVFDITKFDRDPKVTVVLVGYDGAFNYTKLAKAMQYLTRNAGCRFLAANEDSTYPVEGGQLLPATGSLTAPLRYITKADPILVGKPSQAMMSAIRT
ncbi:hypothetical protein FRC00_010072, partial [Tulasnella sp. 408]